MKKVLGILFVVLALACIPMQVFATNPTVTITGTGQYMSISNSPATWAINCIVVPGSLMLKNTTYYSNPLGDTTPPTATVADGSCRFTITNSSNVPLDVTANMTDFGSAYTMTNSNAGTNGVGIYGAYIWYSSEAYASKTVLASSGSAAFLDDLATATTTQKWGLEVLTQTDDFGSASAVTSTLTLSFAAS